MLALESISASYGSICVLHAVSLQFAPGSLTAIVGPNGGGKSTLLRVAAGLMAPESGSVKLDGKAMASLTNAQRAKRLAFVSQRPTAAADFSVREVVRLGRFASGRSQRDAHIDDALAAMDLAPLANKPLGTLSVGQQQRVAVARALAQLGLPGCDASPARVILADEPVAAMDPAHALATMEAFKSIAAAGHVVGVVLHDLSLAANAATQVAILSQGRLVMHGPTAQVLDGQALEEAFGTTFRRLKEGGRTIGVVAVGPATLPVP